jgi:D-arabinose 1-dehydrogenase-like Zn-dependent alcohol dehydrogenase
VLTISGLESGILTDGGYAEYCTLDATALAHIPEDADPAKMAPLLCAGVTVFNSMRNMNSESAAGSKYD